MAASPSVRASVAPSTAVESTPSTTASRRAFTSKLVVQPASIETSTPNAGHKGRDRGKGKLMARQTTRFAGVEKWGPKRDERMHSTEIVSRWE